MRADNDRPSVFNVGLKAIEPVCARVCEPLQSQRSVSGKSVGPEFLSLERSVEFPAAVGRIEIMWGDKHSVLVRLRGLENPFHVLDSVVFGDACADHTPAR